MLGIGAQFGVRTVSGFEIFTDQTNATRCSARSPNSLRFSIRFGYGPKRCRFRPQPFVVVSCKSSRGGFGSRSTNGGEDSDDEFLEASLLLSETISHYRMRKRGFQEEEMKWRSSTPVSPFSAKSRGGGVNLLGESFLRRFQSPTIFLKISCNGDFLLPIIVGEYAIEKLIDSQWGDENGNSPDQFQLVRNIVEKLGYKVNMVRITERVVNTYFARLYFSKPGENDILSVDARPSDAINVANRCKAPIYVSRQIVSTDAIIIGYGMGRTRDTKPTYDVSLDSAADGPDMLTEELDLVNDMNLAVKEERYNDAAMLRDRLVKLRESIHEH